ncbi:MAG: hypothetical protein ACFB0B_16540 [Thermonemataceae bacterium]
MKKFTLLTLMMLVTLATQAQSYSFRVLASNGKVLSKANNKRLWAGSTVKSTDQIVLAPNAYLGLIHTNGKTIELKKAGTYKVSTLAAKVSGRQSSTTAKYVNYVVGEMAKADKEDINKNHRKYMAITGSVERSVQGIVKAYLPGNSENIELFGDELYLKLYPADPAKKYDTYEVRVLDMVNKEVAKYTTEEDLVKIDLAKLPYKYDKSWIIYVTAVGEDDPLGPSQYNVSILEEGDKYTVVKKEIEAGSDEANALDKIVQAGVYEQEGLLADAVRSYEEAIALQPDVDTYKIAYKDFLVRTKILPLQVNPDVKAEDLVKEEESK